MNVRYMDLIEERVHYLVTENERSVVNLFVVFLFLGFSAIISDRDF